MQFKVSRAILLSIAISVSVLTVCKPSLAADTGSQYAAGIEQYSKRNYKLALQHFQASLAQGNGSAANYIYMGHSYAALGNIEQAVKMYRKVQKAFKGLPAATQAAQYIQKVDPKNSYPDLEATATAGATPVAIITAPGEQLKINEQSRRGPRGPSLINRINVVAPSVPGHKPVSASTIAAIRSAISKMHNSTYSLLDNAGITIYVAPNFSDKWPSLAGQSKPGLEHYTYAKFPGHTEGLDVYIFERMAEDATGKELDEPFSAAQLEDELYAQMGHALNNALNMSKDPAFIAQYELDKAAIPALDKKRQTLFLQPDGKGEEEVCATAIGVTLGAGPYGNLDRYFKKSKDWVSTRMDQEYRARASASVRGARSVLAAKGTAGSAAPKPTALITPPKNEPLKEATLDMPSQEYIPFTRDQGNHYYVQGSINGKRTNLMIDTGAFTVLVGKQDLMALGIKPPDGPSEYIGSGASGALRGWQMPLEIAVGRIKRKMDVQVLDGKEVMLLGQPFLRGMHYQIDRSRGYIRFMRDSGDIDKEIGNAASIPFRMINGNMMVEAKINGVNTEVNFDTGAPYTLLSMSALWAFNLRPEGSTMIGGAGGSGSMGYVSTADSIEIGPIKKRHFRVVIGTAVGQNVLGQDFFGTSKFIVDNEKHVIRIRE